MAFDTEAAQDTCQLLFISVLANRGGKNMAKTQR